MTAEHPYKLQPPIAFWSKSVSANFDPALLVTQGSALIKSGEKITSAGSCFASNLIPYIESAGFEYIRTEKLPKIFNDMGQNLGYANFSAMYGNIYTARQLNQLYLRAIGEFKPIEDRWILEGEVVDPFRPGLKFKASSQEEFDLITQSHLLATKNAFESADLFVFTLGLTEAWSSKIDGAVFPACPGTISGTFDSNSHGFVNFTVDEIVTDLSNFILKLRLKNPKIRFLLTVSPVPLVATATQKHVLSASTYSKSVLRVAAAEIEKNIPDVVYFPAYEIITGPQAPNIFFESDLRNVSKFGIEVVMEALLKSSQTSKDKKLNFNNLFKRNSSKFEPEIISRQIAKIECDEIMMDETFKNN